MPIDARRSDACEPTIALAVAFAAAGAHGQQPAALEPVVVTGNRVETQVFEAPYAIGVVGAGELRSGGLMVNLSEALVRVPGLVINNRSNYAQDLQISPRLRRACELRGARPAPVHRRHSGLDARRRGQVTHFDLAGAERIEVLRGPFSALYGNSSGGVIALFSAPAAVRARRGRASMPAASGNGRCAPSRRRADRRWLELRAQAAHFEIDGFRPHSAAERDLVNLRARLARRRRHA